MSESRETTFDVDVVDRRELHGRLDGLVSELCAALERHGHRGRTVGLKIRFADFETHTRAKTVGEAVCDPQTVGGIAHQLLDEFDSEEPVRLLGVRVAGFESTAKRGQLSLPIA